MYGIDWMLAKTIVISLVAYSVCIGIFVELKKVLVSRWKVVKRVDKVEEGKNGLR